MNAELKGRLLAFHSSFIVHSSSFIKVDVFEYHVAVKRERVHQGARHIADVNCSGARLLFFFRVIYVNESGTKVKDAKVCAALAHVVAQSFGKAEQAELGGAVRRHVRVAMLSRLRRDVHYVAE